MANTATKAPRRKKFDRGSIESAVLAAQAIATEDSPAYVYASNVGYHVANRPHPFGQEQWKVTPTVATFVRPRWQVLADGPDANPRTIALPPL